MAQIQKPQPSKPATQQQQQQGSGSAPVQQGSPAPTTFRDWAAI